MKHLLRLLVLFISVLPAWALADTPVGPMNYQGRLLDDGVPVGFPTPTAVNFVVRVYNAASGGTLKYQETHNGVTVDDGVYSFLIGTQPKDAGDSTWSIELWNCCANLFLEITANGETLLPRSRLAAAPYAFQANLALTTNNALALGGKPSTWFDNTMEAICVSGKGKWLELANDGAGACLGIGSSYPGPATVPYLDLTTDGDFTNLDLTNADISGIQFDDATMTGTIFKGTTYSVAGMSGANLRDTVWDAAVATDASKQTLSSSTNVMGVIFKNMDMSSWDFSQIDPFNGMIGLSAANLSYCPAELPSAWECRDDALGQNKNFLLGPGVNLSANSAAAVSKFGASYLNLGNNVFDNANLQGASFEGNVVTQSFQNVNLDNANFNYTIMRSNLFDACNVDGATFVGSKFDKPKFLSTNYFLNNDFTNADLTYVRFEKEMIGSNFTKATLITVDFIGGIYDSNFTGAVLDEVAILGGVGGNIFDGTRFYHGFQHGRVSTPYNSFNGFGTFKDLSFIGGQLKGDFTGAVFTGTLVFSGNVTGNFGLDICGATFPLVGGVLPGISIGLGAECPDGNDYAPCNSPTNMIPIPVAQCTVGVP